MKKAMTVAQSLALLASLGVAGQGLQAQLWDLQAVRIARDCYAVDSVDSSTVFFCGVEKSSGKPAVFRSTDGGMTWAIFPWNDWGIYDLSAVDSLHIWAVNIHRIYHSVDGGRSWEVQFDASSDTTVTKFLDYIEMFDALHGVAVGDAPASAPLAVLVTEDGGKTWVSRNRSYFLGAWLSDLWRGVQFVSPAVGFGRFACRTVPVDSFFLQKTTTGGAAWSPLPIRADKVNVVRFFDEQIGLAAWKGDSPIYLTRDGGATWTAHEPALGERWFQDLEFLPGDPSTVFAALAPTDWGNPRDVLAVSNDTGKTWTALPTPSIGCPRDIDMADAAHGWVVGDGGVLRIRAAASRVVSGGPRPTPASFVLHAIRPNPFSGSASISFELPEPQRVTIEIFNVCGQKVAVLADGQAFPAGRHSLLFRDPGLPSGLYLCRVSVGAELVSRRIALLK
ncbi:MAG: T9SS type A sorting domain-containing protein [Calditrichaeota bacterium]|nr:T9SS type A sorting domain-containing protein [Calditrichota bacterium]